MISYYLGIPGSGKSYSGVNTIYNNFSTNEDAKKDLKKDYEVCYTNINEFKYDLVSNVKKFDFDIFMEHLIILHDMYKKKADDTELITKAKELNLYKALFVLDECHNYLDVEKKPLVWWFTYHRHLYHDIILITQSLSLVNAKYKPLAEAFYKAKSSSLTLNKKYFNYMYYTEARLTKASYVNTIKVKKRQAVFKLYHSGDSVESKNIIKRFLMIAFFMVFVLFLLGYLFYYKKEKDINKTSSKSHKQDKVFTSSTSSNVNSVTSDSNNNIDDDFEEKKLIIFNCSFSACSSNSLSLPPQLVKKFIDMELLHVYYREIISKSLTVYYLSTSTDFYNFLNSSKGEINEKDSDNNSLDLFHSSSK